MKKRNIFYEEQKMGEMNILTRSTRVNNFFWNAPKK